MPRGGKRVNAGRKKGSDGEKSKQRRALVEKGIDPLAVLLHVMRWHFRARRFDKAAAIAKDAAPYVTPRLAAVTVKGDEEQPLCLVEEFVIVHACTSAGAPTGEAPPSSASGAGALPPG